MSEFDLPTELIEPTKLKLEAEAKAARAEADHFQALTAKAYAEANSTDLAARHNRIMVDREEQKREIELLGPDFQREYNFSAAVDATSVSKCMTDLERWSRLDKSRGEEPRDIHIRFFSPGGSVIDGLALFDFIQQLKLRGHFVHTSCIGFAASMGGILLQAGDVRTMSKESWILIHEISASMSGSFGAMKDRQRWLDRIQDRILNIFAARSQGSGCEKPLSAAQFKTRWNRTDWWLDSNEALRHGVVDRVE